MDKEFDDTTFSELVECSYANVRTYNRLRDSYPTLSPPTGDLKNYQRPWVADAVLQNIPRGAPILEIGGGGGEVADYLSDRGYEVWAVDPYDGSAGGNAKYKSIVERFPHIKIVRDMLHTANDLPTGYFHACYSCSVIEHIPKRTLGLTTEKMYSCLVDGGTSIHSIDWTLEVHKVEFSMIEALISHHGFTIDLQRMEHDAMNDIDTFFLSPQGHYEWRKFLRRSYDEYPYRKVTAFDLIAKK